MANEVSEQLEFLRCQMNLATFDGDAVRPQIEVEMAGFQYGRSGIFQQPGLSLASCAEGSHHSATLSFTQL